MQTKWMDSPVNVFQKRFRNISDFEMRKSLWWKRNLHCEFQLLIKPFPKFQNRFQSLPRTALFMQNRLWSPQSRFSRRNQIFSLMIMDKFMIIATKSALWIPIPSKTHFRFAKQISVSIPDHSLHTTKSSVLSQSIFTRDLNLMKYLQSSPICDYPNEICTTNFNFH